MDWFSVSVFCRAEVADLAAEILETLGAKGVAIKDPVGEQKAIGVVLESAAKASIPDDLDPARTVSVTGYYSNLSRDEIETKRSAEEMLAHMSESLKESGIDAGKVTVETAGHRESDWETAWKHGFKKLRIGRRIIIAPPWDLPESVDANEAVLIIDPGMAFGTGTHATTRLCLSMIERFVKPGDVVADVGTGSGILAIAAAKLGASFTYGWDFDPVAIESANKNAKANRVEERVRFFVHESGAAQEGEPSGGNDPAHSLKSQCDVVVANISADTLAQIADKLKTIVKANGSMVLSGITSGKEEACLQAFLDKGFRLVERMREGEWVALCLKIGEH